MSAGSLLPGFSTLRHQSADNGFIMAATEPTAIWQHRWFQFLLAVLLVLLVGMFIIRPLLALLYATRTVLVPVVVALALAYAINPLVTGMERRAKLPRPLSAILILMLSMVVVVGLFTYLTPTLRSQVQQLYDSGQSYTQKLSHRLDLTAWQQRAQQVLQQQLTPGTDPTIQQPHDLTLPNIKFGTISRGLLRAFDIGYEVVSGTIGFITYLSLFTVILAFCFFFFVWKFQPVLEFFIPFIPINHRRRTLEILGRMDKTVSGFIRGRLIQSAVMATVLSVGWNLIDVPYWLLLGIAGGILNLIPFVAVTTWPLAILLAWLDGSGVGAPFSIWWVVVWPSIVYFIAQSLDGWLIEPLVQGKATDLDPLTVLLCVLVGGALMGLLGMLLAIPATACIKILMREVILPKLRELAAKNQAA